MTDLFLLFPGFHVRNKTINIQMLFRWIHTHIYCIYRLYTWKYIHMSAQYQEESYNKKKTFMMFSFQTKPKYTSSCTTRLACAQAVFARIYICLHKPSLFLSLFFPSFHTHYTNADGLKFWSQFNLTFLNHILFPMEFSFIKHHFNLCYPILQFRLKRAMHYLLLLQSSTSTF